MQKLVTGFGALVLFASSTQAQVPLVAPAAPVVALTPTQMFLHADIVVQAVMAGLVLASIVVWALWLLKMVQISLSAARLRQALAGLVPGFSTAAAPRLRGVAAQMLGAAGQERVLSAGLARDGVLERAASELSALETACQRRLQAGVALIGTVAATAPFIGLFGTVWGIMNSFTGIAASKTTNLAVVAPGIAEALLATGIGLVAAIPALILFNHLTRRLAAHRAALSEVARRIVSALSRDLDRAAAEDTPEASRTLMRRGA